MKKNNCIANASKATTPAHVKYCADSLAGLPESTGKLKGKIVGWHWESLQETHAVPGQMIGVA